MNDPLTPAALEKLHALHALAEDPDRTFPHQLVFRDALYEHAGGLLAAARERDALKVELEVHKGAANHLRSDLAAEVRRLRTELAEARAVLIVIERNALSCPICCMHFRSGHSPGCAFAAALGKSTVPLAPADLAELIEANALLEDCAGQFLMSDDDGTVHHSFMSTEEALCRHLVKIGRLVPVGHERFRWAEQKPTMPTGQEKEVADLRLVFGLRAQGHLPTVETMLAEGCAWDEIGIAIGWCPKTAAEYYGRERKEPIPTMPTEQEKS